jgi:NADH-quinone oxidoreductase subunit A
MTNSFLAILAAISVGAGFAIGMMKLFEFLGPRRASKEKLSTYESGMEPISSARERYSVKFYLVAMLFILFDVEVIFMYPWAVQFKSLGINGIIAMLLFMILLFSGFIYVVKKGALEWD